MTCPQCNIPLVIAERKQIEIDYCPSCRGVWLDRGELDKIVERSNRDTETRNGDRGLYDGDDRRGERDRKPFKKKREGFLGELFDF